MTQVVSWADSFLLPDSDDAVVLSPHTKVYNSCFIGRRYVGIALHLLTAHFADAGILLSFCSWRSSNCVKDA